MFIPANRAPANLQSLPDGIITRLISHDDIAPLAERRDDTGNRREGVSIHNTRLRAQMRRNVRLGLHMHILRAVELRGSAGPDAIRAQGLDGLLFDLLVGYEVVVVVGCEVRDGAAVGEFGFRPRASAYCKPMYHTHTPLESDLPNNNRQFLHHRLLEIRQRSNERLRGPLIDQIINLLYTASATSLLPPLSSEAPTHLLRQRHKVLPMRRIARRQQIPHEEHHEDQLDGRPHRVVLVARPHIPDQHRRPGHFLEALRYLVHVAERQLLRIVEFHDLVGRVSCCVPGRNRERLMFMSPKFTASRLLKRRLLSVT